MHLFIILAFLKINVAKFVTKFVAMKLALWRSCSLKHKTKRVIKRLLLLFSCQNNSEF